MKIPQLTKREKVGLMIGILILLVTVIVICKGC